MTESTQRAGAKWWQTFYDDIAMIVLADKDPQQVRRQVDTITRLTKLTAGKTAIDQCCGVGQHAHELADRGCHVVALDQSPFYIDHARQVANERQVAVEFLVADAFNYQHPKPVDVVYNWHSSFGYAMQDATNQQMLVCARRSLRQDGSMLLEYPNMLYLLAHFQESIQSNHPAGISLIRNSWIDIATGVMHQRWIYHRDEIPVRSHDSALRIYMPNQLIEMFYQSGFDQVQALAGDGETLTRHSPRCILLARNP